MALIELNERGLGGRAQMLMPQYMRDRAEVSLKDTVNTSKLANTTAFYSAFETDFTPIGFDTATLIPLVNTLEQEIMNTGTGAEGVLTQIKSSSMNPAGIMTIRVYIDGGSPIIFTSTLPLTTDVLCVGDFVPWEGASGSISVGYHGGNNGGYAPIITQNLGMLAPSDSLSRGLPNGLVFKDSLRVTIQGGTNLSGTPMDKACVAWLTSIPEGL